MTKRRQRPALALMFPRQSDGRKWTPEEFVRDRLPLFNRMHGYVDYDKDGKVMKP